MSEGLKSPKGALIVSLIFLVFVISAFFSACKSDYPASAREGRQGEAKEARQVKTVAVVETPFGETVTANGTLAAFEQTTVSVKVPGRLRAISVDLGTVVSKGQVIAQLEPEDYKLRVQQSEAALAQARARLGLTPEGEDDRVDPEQTATVRQARAVLDEARFNRDRAAKPISTRQTLSSRLLKAVIRTLMKRSETGRQCLPSAVRNWD
jgi:multidrug efflux pump subunit AcrA (membrane-fusion protein)